MKPKLVIKSLADLPAQALAFAVSTPGRALNASRERLGAVARGARVEIGSAGSRTAVFTRRIFARADGLDQGVPSWQRGGINE